MFSSDAKLTELRPRRLRRPGLRSIASNIGADATSSWVAGYAILKATDLPTSGNPSSGRPTKKVFSKTMPVIVITYPDRHRSRTSSKYAPSPQSTLQKSNERSTSSGPTSSSPS